MMGFFRCPGLGEGRGPLGDIEKIGPCYCRAVVAPHEPAESGRLKLVVAGLSSLALAGIGALLWGLPDGATRAEPGLVPTLNAVFNAGAAVCLMLGRWQIRRGRPDAHKRAMLGAFAFSTAFFIGYVVHHARVGSVPFEHVGPVRALYFSVLIPHVVLAAPLVPMALLTLVRGLRGARESHRRLARFTHPIWLFVSVSGVVVYAMLYHL